MRALRTWMVDRESPSLAIVGGAKLSTKLVMIQKLSRRVDRLIVGGGIANTFLAARGQEVGKSLYQPEFLAQAQNIMNTCDVILPIDVVVAPSTQTEAQIKNCADPDDMILDIGPKTQQLFRTAILQAKSILWNGPVGLFEQEPFSSGTRAVTTAVVESEAFSVVGGGDTLAAITKFCPDKAPNISHISMGGGALLDYIQGGSLPCISLLESLS